MGFQSLVYDQNGRLVACVEPTERAGAPTHEQLCRLIESAPAMYDLLVTAADAMDTDLPKTAQMIRGFLAGIEFDQNFELRSRGPR